MGETQNKPKVALYWAASCGGCDCAVVDIGAPLLDVAAQVEFVLWPVALDFKYHHIMEMPDKNIDLCMFNGAIRSDEQEEIAKLLRQKSKILVAWGACAQLGGVPGLSNFSTRERTLKTAYEDVPSVQSEDKKIRPQLKTQVKEGELRIPELFEKVLRLDQVVEVDYYLPGCPPTPEQTAKFLLAVLAGQLPPKGATFGETKTLCDECGRKREQKKVKKFYRPYEKKPDPEKCLLDQGYTCMGPVTRGGCETLCIKANMPCTGCYGPTANIADVGAAYISTLASIVDTDDDAEAKKIIDGLTDIAGMVYRYSLPSSMLNKEIKHK
ncbi:MAG: oxidoreductase [Candidatus Omnitrophota bacterium]